MDIVVTQFAQRERVFEKLRRGSLVFIRDGKIMDGGSRGNYFRNLYQDPEDSRFYIISFFIFSNGDCGLDPTIFELNDAEVNLDV